MALKLLFLQVLMGLMLTVLTCAQSTVGNAVETTPASDAFHVKTTVSLLESPTVDEFGHYRAAISITVKNTGTRLVRVQGWQPMGAERHKGQPLQVRKWKLIFIDKGAPRPILSAASFPICGDLEPGQHVQGLVELKLGKTVPRKLELHLFEPNDKPVYGPADIEFLERVEDGVDHPRKVMLEIKRQLAAIKLDLGDH